MEERSIFSKKWIILFQSEKLIVTHLKLKNDINGIFEQDPQVNLSDLKSVFYVYMKIADSDIRHQVDSSKYYYESSNIWKTILQSRFY